MRVCKRGMERERELVQGGVAVYKVSKVLMTRQQLMPQHSYRHTERERERDGRSR